MQPIPFMTIAADRPEVSGNQQRPQTPFARPGLWVAALASVFLVLMLGNTPLKQPVLGAYLLCSLPLMVGQRASLGSMLARSPSLIALILWIGASLAWSVVPSASKPIVLSQMGLIALAMLITCRQAEAGFGPALRHASVLFLGLTVLYSLAFPGAAFTGDGMKGFLGHKNHLGAMLAACALVLWHTPGRSRWHLLGAVAAAGLVLLTRSKTAIALLVICNVLWPLAAGWSRLMYRRHSELLLSDVVRFFLWISAMLALGLLVAFRDDVLTFLWRHLPKTALTGRGTLWLVVIQQLGANTLTGLGPGVFWQADGASEIARTTLYMKDPRWVQHMVSADGSYTDIVAAYGMAGLALFLWTVIDLYRRLFKLWALPDARLMFVLSTFVLLHGVSETTLLYSPNLLWLVYLLCYLRVAQGSSGLPLRGQSR